MSSYADVSDTELFELGVRRAADLADRVRRRAPWRLERAAHHDLGLLADEAARRGLGRLDWLSAVLAEDRRRRKVTA